MNQSAFEWSRGDIDDFGNEIFSNTPFWKSFRHADLAFGSMGAFQFADVAPGYYTQAELVAPLVAEI